MSLIVKSILNADADARYLNPGELEPIKSFVKSGERRLRLVQSLTENRDRIVKQAGNQLFQKRPDIVSPGGNAYGQEMTATCLRDMDYYLRLITYSIVAGDSTPIQEIGVIGAREMYRSLGTPIEGVVEGIRGMKNATISMMSAEDSQEVSGYFDYLIASLQ
ncbi:allophycocyanin alpha subunit ApcA [Nostoc sp. HK-01]|uniref:Allophycocyanin alpha subunit ApcA n=2 Tax=Nostocales TaxID=1161 RepID=A0A1Z4GBI8_9CYAN|nr:allophycocyanin [Nostoc cycadae]BAY14874.1 allophycocyanin alpha subunit ApcA [Anabaenopsis circularis NIES-21]BBD60970.1 allophycocyanin alpha subunit ApcA [Nostoc sp. HK-01]GBE91682.1 allophycocyanin subunit alpha apoprotein [Nostoc cycadae WK-1]